MILILFFAPYRSPLSLVKKYAPLIFFTYFKILCFSLTAELDLDTLR